MFFFCSRFTVTAIAGHPDHGKVSHGNELLLKLLTLAGCAGTTRIPKFLRQRPRLFFQTFEQLRAKATAALKAADAATAMPPPPLPAALAPNADAPAAAPAPIATPPHPPHPPSATPAPNAAAPAAAPAPIATPPHPSAAPAVATPAVAVAATPGRSECVKVSF